MGFWQGFAIGISPVVISILIFIVLLRTAKETKGWGNMNKSVSPETATKVLTEIKTICARTLQLPDGMLSECASISMGEILKAMGPALKEMGFKDNQVEK